MSAQGLIQPNAFGCSVIFVPTVWMCVARRARVLSACE